MVICQIARSKRPPPMNVKYTWAPALRLVGGDEQKSRKERRVIGEVCKYDWLHSLAHGCRSNKGEEGQRCFQRRFYEVPRQQGKDLMAQSAAREELSRHEQWTPQFHGLAFAASNPKQNLLLFLEGRISSTSQIRRRIRFQSQEGHRCMYGVASAGNRPR